jgi:hypothetical protein
LVQTFGYGIGPRTDLLRLIRQPNAYLQALQET